MTSNASFLNFRFDFLFKSLGASHPTLISKIVFNVFPIFLLFVLIRMSASRTDAQSDAFYEKVNSCSLVRLLLHARTKIAQLDPEEQAKTQYLLDQVDGSDLSDIMKKQFITLILNDIE